MSEPEPLVSSTEAARRIGVSRRSLSRWAAEGVVRPAAVLPGGRLRWDVADLLRQLEERRRRGE